MHCSSSSPHPTRNWRRIARAGGCFGALALLSACAGGQRISSSQEAQQYEQRAHGSYSAPGSQSDPWGPYVHEASVRYDVPERWIREVMRVESGGRTEMNGRPITSGAGAMGLMQVMPGTYDELRRRYSLGDDPYDPHNSILAGAAYIRELYDLYGSPGFLAAYNGGPGRLDDYLTRNRPLPEETRRYVAKIGPRIVDAFPAKRATSELYAMNGVPASIPAGPRYPEPAVAAAAPAQPTQSMGPVEVAYAPPSANDGAFDPPPGWTPRGMSRAETAAYVPPPASPPPASPPPASPPPAAPMVAALLPPAEPAPVVAAALTPPSGYEPAPMPTQRAELDYPLPRPAPAPARVARAEPLPLPPPPAPTVQTASAYAYAPQTLRHDTGLHLVGAANAAPAPAYRGLPGQWAIQVGAFGNEGLAHSAVGAARDQAGGALAGAHPAVAGVREPHGTLYRARLTGLSREAAHQACERLRGHGTCIVLSPDSQS